MISVIGSSLGQRAARAFSRVTQAANQSTPASLHRAFRRAIRSISPDSPRCAQPFASHSLHCHVVLLGPATLRGPCREIAIFSLPAGVSSG